MKTSVFQRGALAAALALLGSAAQATDLVDAWRQAQQNDPNRLAAEASVLAGREAVVQGRALLLPRINLTAGASRVSEHSSSIALPAPLAGQLDSGGSSTQSDASVRLTHPLYDQKARADSRQLAQQTELAEVRWRAAQQDLIERVGEAYFGVLLAQENLRVVRAEKAAVGQQRDRAQARFDVGRGKATDLQEAQARYDAVLAQEVSATSTLALREAQYQELTGAAPAALAPLRDDFAPTPPAPADLAGWQSRGAVGNAQVQGKLAELEMARAEVDKNRLAARPTLDLVAAVSHRGRNGSSGSFTPDSSRSAQIGLQFNLPLYAGGGLDSREREAVAKQQRAAHELDAARRDARLQVQDGFLAVHTGVSRVAAQAQALRSALTALEATTLGRDVGSRTEIDVLDAQQRVHAAQRDLAQSRHDYLLGRLRLAAATGELQEGDLQALNRYLAR